MKTLLFLKTTTLPVAIFLNLSTADVDRAVAMIFILVAVAAGALIILRKSDWSKKVRMISVKGLSVKIGSFSLKDINLDIPEGGYFMVVGPTGAGKTIILESIAGLQRFRSGEIWISGKDVTSLPPEQRQIGYVPQDYALFPFLNVRDNITFGLRRMGNNKQQNKERMESLAHILGIHHLLERSVRKLSGGEKQRVAIARALAISPKVLLLDEPMGSLDVRTAKYLRLELKRYHEELGITIWGGSNRSGHQMRFFSTRGVHSWLTLLVRRISSIVTTAMILAMGSWRQYAGVFQ